MNFHGIAIGMLAFLIIGIFHLIVPEFLTLVSCLFSKTEWIVKKFMVEPLLPELENP